MDKQIVRQAFRDAVYARDNHTCVVPGCGLPGQDAHHIIERNLWKDPSEEGGYWVDNGASVCEKHHRHAEANYIPPHALRIWAGITKRVLPSGDEGLDPNKIWNKWGVELDTPNRSADMPIKYQGSMYLTYSPSVNELDITERGYMLSENLLYKPLVITTKMDGGNVLLVPRGVAARNAHSAEHPSLDMLKQKHTEISHLLHPDFQLFGEWLYAKHSIHYTKEKGLALDDYLQLFAVYYRPMHLWLGWDGVEKWAERIGVSTVPVIGKGWNFIDENRMYKELNKVGEDLMEQGHEGFVVRSMYPYHYGQFKENLAKWVRPNHVQTDRHWSKNKIVRNELK